MINKSLTMILRLRKPSEASTHQFHSMSLAEAELSPAGGFSTAYGTYKSRSEPRMF